MRIKVSAIQARLKALQGKESYNAGNSRQIKDSAAFVGQGPTFQIWNPENLAEHQEKARYRILKEHTTIGALSPKEKGDH